MNFFKRSTPTPSTHQRDPFEEARHDPHSLGNLAILRGYITVDELEAALRVQKERLKIGDILVEMGTLSRDQLEELLLEQKILRGEVKDRNVLIDFEQRRKRNRLMAVKDKFAEARGTAEEMTAAVTATLLKADVNGG